VKPIVASAVPLYAPTSMLNDRSSILSLLETRRSAKPRELVGAGPSTVEMERMLAMATRVPDHGKLHPWRLVTVAEDQRDALASRGRSGDRGVGPEKDEDLIRDPEI